MKHLFISHKSCTDGFAAAWAFSVYAHRAALKDVEYHYAGYGSEPPWEQIDSETYVYIGDFSYPRAVLEEIKRRAYSLLVFDHHKTAQADLAGLDYALFDMERSGAGIVWDYFNFRETRPWLIDYVEDRDLWRHRIPHTKEVNAYLATSPKEFVVWDNLAKASLETVVQFGKVILEFIRQRNQEIVSNARIVEFAGYSVPCVNCTAFFNSDVGDMLDGEYPFAIMWNQDKSGIYRYSLRSNTKTGVDVSAIARQFGGGGHKNAAGFSSTEKLC